MVARSKVAITRLNTFDPEEIEELILPSRRVEACLRLAILLLKLNSKSGKAAQWASGLTRGPKDVA